MVTRIPRKFYRRSFVPRGLLPARAGDRRGEGGEDDEMEEEVEEEEEGGDSGEQAGGRGV